jgi:hypothetical protein
MRLGSAPLDRDRTGSAAGFHPPEGIIMFDGNRARWFTPQKSFRKAGTRLPVEQLEGRCVPSATPTLDFCLTPTTVTPPVILPPS